MVQQSSLNIEKAYEFDPIWSGFNLDMRNVIKKKIKFTKRWLWLSFWDQFFCLFSVCFLFWHDFILGDWWVCQCVHTWQLSFQFCIFMFCVWNGSMMKPTWMLSRVGSLKKAPLSAETLEKRCLTELNIVNNHHSKNKWRDEFDWLERSMQLQILISCAGLTRHVKSFPTLLNGSTRLKRSVRESSLHVGS